MQANLLCKQIWYASKSVFYCVTVICTITKGKEQTRACVSHYDQSAWTAN